MNDGRLVLRLCSLARPEARELAADIGGEATVVSDEMGPAGGYGDLGTRTVAVVVSARSLRAVARYLAGREEPRGETVRVAVEIQRPDGSRRPETLTYRAAPGQSRIEAAGAALRALPGVGEALERSVW